MEVTRLFLVLVVLAGSAPSSTHGRRPQVIGRSADGVEKPLRYLIVPSTGVPAAGPSLVFDSEPERSDRAESRVFNDFPSYVGSYVYQGAVRRVLIRPLLRGARRLIPGRAVKYYNNRLAHRRVFRMSSRYVYPVVSSYVYGKFEEGVFKSLRRGFTFFRDNFIEFERRKKRAIESK